MCLHCSLDCFRFDCCHASNALFRQGLSEGAAENVLFLVRLGYRIRLRLFLIDERSSIFQASKQKRNTAFAVNPILWTVHSFLFSKYFSPVSLSPPARGCSDECPERDQRSNCIREWFQDQRSKINLRIPGEEVPFARGTVEVRFAREWASLTTRRDQRSQRSKCKARKSAYLKIESKNHVSLFQMMCADKFHCAYLFYFKSDLPLVRRIRRAQNIKCPLLESGYQEFEICVIVSSFYTLATYTYLFRTRARLGLNCVNRGEINSDGPWRNGRG